MRSDQRPQDAHCVGRIEERYCQHCRECSCLRACIQAAIEMERNNGLRMRPTEDYPL